MSVELLNPDIKLNVEIDHTLAALEQRGIQSLFVANRRAALMTVLELIPHGSTIAHGHHVI